MKKPFLSYLLIVVLCSVAFAQSPLEKVPEGVFFVTEKAEDLIDLYLKEDWTGAQRLVDKIAQHQEEVEQAMRRNQLPDSTIDLFGYFIYRLQTLSKEKQQPILAALSANQITALLIDLQRFYIQTTPLDIARVDYMGREIVLLAQVQINFGLLARRISELAGIWDKFKFTIQTLKAPKGEEVTSQVSQVIAALKSGETNSQIIKNGKHLLDLVDKLEALYK
jgi:hypothetical protein